MATATKARIAVTILERLDLTQSKVDRENCVIRDVKILGRTSQNRHGMPGVTGTDYLPEAHESAKSLYEGIQVNVGHPPRNDPDAERHPDDRNGVLKDVTVRGGETFGNWHLIPSHPMTSRFLDCAENPILHSQFALSHNAKGYGDVREGRYQIKEIPLVRSVDVVTAGGCNTSLFESKENKMKKPFRDVLESATPEVQIKFANLLEEFGDMGDLPADPVPETDSGNYETHCAEMVKSIILHAELSAEEKINKIKTALKILDGGDAAGDEPDGDEPEEITESEDMDTEKKDAMESKEKLELKQLRDERKARDLCESLEFVPSKMQLKALTALEGDIDRKAMIREFKAVAAPAKKSNTPRTATTRNTIESKEPVRDNKAFLASITR